MKPIVFALRKTLMYSLDDVLERASVEPPIEIQEHPDDAVDFDTWILIALESSTAFRYVPLNRGMQEWRR